MNWLKYLLEANLYLAGFYALYYIIFRRETYYQLNRIYLLACTVLAFVIPVIQVGILNPPATGLQDVVVTVYSYASAGHHWLLADYILLGYALIASVLLTNLCIKIFKLIRLSRTNRKEVHSTYKLIELSDENNAFSFFNYLFIGSALINSPAIIKHELTHIRQKHSWDIIYLEILKAINWFNPVIWLMQGSIREVHEFIADSQSVSAEISPERYTDFLVDNAYGINQNILTNTFFNKNLLKKRIMMLHQKRSGSAARLKYLLIVPLMCGMLCASTLVFAKTYGWIDLAPRYNSSELNISGKTNKNLRLKVTLGGTSFITDKIAFKNNKGESKVYTVNSLTNQDKEFLLTSQNVKIEVVEAAGTSAPAGRMDLSDTLKKRKMVKHHIDSVNKRINQTIRKEIDSAKAKYSAIPPPPPPPVPPVKVKSGPKAVRILPPAVPMKTSGDMKIKRPPPPPPKAPDVTIDEPVIKKTPPPPPVPPVKTTDTTKTEK